MKEIYIDWSKAPEGTTHAYAPDHHWINGLLMYHSLWEKHKGGSFQEWSATEGWGQAILTYCMHSRIAKPIEDIKMTPFEVNGWTKDTKFKVISDSAGVFEIEDIVWLLEDEGDDLPVFTSGLKEGYLDIDGVGYGSPEVAPLINTKISEDDFIPWNGGECPVKIGTMVHVKYRYGGESIVSAGTYRGGVVEHIHIMGSYTATSWNQPGGGTDIVAYKLYKAPQDTLTKGDTKVLTEGGNSTKINSDSLKLDMRVLLKIQGVDHILTTEETHSLYKELKFLCQEVSQIEYK